MRKYCSVRVGGKIVAVGSKVQCRAYYRRHHWGSRDGFVMTAFDDHGLMVQKEAIAAGAKVLGKRRTP